MIIPYAWITEESVWRLEQGGNCKGAVPIHKKKSSISKIPLYKGREWVSLTDEEISQCWSEKDTPVHGFARVIEAKLKEKNT